MTVVGCTGHRSIPSTVYEAVAVGIRTEVRRHSADALVGVCSLAVGADQLFARTVLADGGRLHAVLPCHGYDATFTDGERSAFRSLLREADQVETLEHPGPSAAAFFAAGCRVVDLCDVLIAVWDGRAADGGGGTADAVEYARARGIDIIQLWPSHL